MVNLYNTNQKGIIFPVSNTVLLPGVITMIHFTKPEPFLVKQLENENTVNIALPLKQNFNQNELKEEDFFKIGISFSVKNIEKIDNDLHVTIQTADRVEIETLRIEDHVIHAEYILSPDYIDINEYSQNDILDYLKKSSVKSARTLKVENNTSKSLTSIRTSTH